MMSLELNELPGRKVEVVSGVSVTYYESGSGAPLILLHGWPQTPYMWRKVLPELEKFYHVYAIELPGMGNEHPAEKADTKTVAHLLKSFCDQLALDGIHLMAHDIGAWVATAFSLEYETSLKSLTVLDAGIPGLIPDELFSLTNANKIWQFYFHSVDQIPELLIVGKEKEYLTWYFTRKSAVKGIITNADIDVYTKSYTGADRLKNGFDYYRAYTESVEQIKSYTKKLAIPILAIGGENAQGLNMGIAMQKIALNKIISASIPECGHYVAEEQPEKFLNLFLKFAGSIDRND